MRRFILLFIAVNFIFISSLLSQAPMHYNYQGQGTGNVFPFAQTLGKAVNWLFLPNDFNTPNPAPSGIITKIYFYTSAGGTRTFHNLQVLMAQSTITTLTTGTFYPGPWDTVYFKSSVTITAPTGGWFSITLQRPFTYDSSKSLVLFVGQCDAAGNGFTIPQQMLSPVRRVWSVGGCPFTPFASGDGYIVNFGIDIVPLTPQYYNQNTGSGINLYPWGQSSGQRVNWLIPSGSIINPSPVPSGGAITALYFLMGNTATATFFNFTIKLGQAAITVLPTSWYTGTTDTVYFRSSVQLSSVNNRWMVIPLANPYNFNVAQGLILDAFQCGHTPPLQGLYVRQSLGPTGTRNYGIPGCPYNYLGQDGSIINFGVSMIFPVGNNNNNNNFPSSYKLEQNYPNPFNPVTNISYSIPKSSFVKLVVYDMLGREVAVLENTHKQAGRYTVNFDASSLSSGVYLYKIEAGGFTESKKMMLVK